MCPLFHNLQAQQNQILCYLCEKIRGGHETEESGAKLGGLCPFPSPLRPGPKTATASSSSSALCSGLSANFNKLKTLALESGVHGQRCAQFHQKQYRRRRLKQKRTSGSCGTGRDYNSMKAVQLIEYPIPNPNHKPRSLFQASWWGTFAIARNN